MAVMTVVMGMGCGSDDIGDCGRMNCGVDGIGNGIGGGNCLVFFMEMRFHSGDEEELIFVMMNLRRRKVTLMSRHLC